MSKTKLAIVSLILLGVSLSCNSFRPAIETAKNTGPVIDFNTDPAQMDCKQAEQTHRDLLMLESTGRLVDGKDPIVSLAEYKSKLEKRLLECKGSSDGRSYRVNGQSNNVSFTGEICTLEKTFSIDAKFPGGTAKTTFAPSGSAGGTTTVSGGGGGCTHSGGGNYTVAFPEGVATLSWTTSDTIACPGFSNSKTATFKLPLQPASDLKCP